ncbi:MAG: MotA/TolQ/ExbB proton channel family protein [Polyangia bacterium]
MNDFLDRFGGYMASGGWVMIPLLVSAAVIWFAIGFRFLTLRRGNRRSVRILVERYSAGYDRRPAGIVDHAAKRAVEIAARESDNLRRTLDAALSVHDVELQRFSTSIRAFVAAAPLLGLLGTVIGMIETFDSLGDMSLFSQSGGIAGGISQALFTTQMGLAVAIPGLLVGRVLDHRQHAFENEISKIKDIVCATYEGGEA